MSRLPWSSRANASREFWACIFFSFALALIEGGVISVFLKQTFAGVMEERWQNLLVGLAGAATELANLVSFGWIVASHGKRKVPFIAGLHVAALVCIAALAFMPHTGAGLIASVALVIAARACWSGVVTLRTAVWRANYPRHVRPHVVAGLASAVQTVVALGGLGLGMAMDADRENFRRLAPLACAVALLGAASYSRIRMRGERAAREAEKAAPVGSGVLKPWAGLAAAASVMKRDRPFAQFMLCMFVLGLGNLMMMPVLAISLKAQFGLGYTASILVTSTIPSMVMLMATRVWARLLDRSHVVKFRSIHSWTFVLSSTAFIVGAWTGSLPMMYAGAVFWGVGLGGGALAWNLGHTDFAPPAETSRYMATHVTLNGVRGLMAPLLAVGMYNAFHDHRGEGGLEPSVPVLAAALTLNASGAIGFMLLNRAMGRPGRGSREA